MRKVSVLAICLLLITSFLTISSMAESKQKMLIKNTRDLTGNLPSLPQEKRQQLINKAANRAIGAAALIKEINAGIHPIPRYMYNNSQLIIIVSSYKQFGEKSGDEAGRGIAIARDPKTRQWSAPIFVTLKDGYIRDLTEPRNINDQFSDSETTMVFFGMHENAKSIFCKEETNLGNLAGLIVLSGSFQYRKHVGESAALSVGIFGYVYSQKLIIGASIEESAIKQDKVLNEAVYETKVLDQFLPPAPFIPKTVLACTDMMNQAYPGNR